MILRGHVREGLKSNKLALLTHNVLTIIVYVLIFCNPPQVEDAGQYMCSVAVPGTNRPQVKHSVSIRNAGENRFFTKSAIV